MTGENNGITCMARIAAQARSVATIPRCQEEITNAAMIVDFCKSVGVPKDLSHIDRLPAYEPKSLTIAISEIGKYEPNQVGYWWNVLSLRDYIDEGYFDA